MAEPFLISQYDGPMDRDQRLYWMGKQASEARRQGGTFARVTMHPKNPDLILFESWKEWPDEQGDPRWFGGKTEVAS